MTPTTDQGDYGNAVPYYRNKLRWTIPQAAMNPSGSISGQGGFDPGAPPEDNGWPNQVPMDPSAFRVDTSSSSGPGGMGLSGQPEAPKPSGNISAGAGKVMGGAKMPPPGMTQQPAPTASAPQGPPTSAGPWKSPVMPPPGVTPEMQQQMQDIKGRMADRAANPPAVIGQRPQDIDPVTGKEKLGAKAASWGQRLALAVLSATKLAPYAQQIVHPDYTQQVAQAATAEGMDEKQLGAIEKEQSIGASGEFKASQAASRARDAQTRADEDTRKVAADQAAEQLKGDVNFTKSLGKDDVITGLDASDPQLSQLQQQGWHITDDLRDHREGVPKMKVAIPPRFATVTPENSIILTGRKPGELVPWSEYKSSLAEYEKQSRALALENAKAPKVSPVTEAALGMRASGAKTGIAEIDLMTTEQAEKARTKPAVTNINNMGAQQDNETNAQMIANYQTAPLAGFVMKSPEGRAIMSRVHTINPEYHSEYYNNFNKTETDATTGKIGTSANALNTMIGHLSVLDQAADALKNNNIQVLNRLANFVGVQSGASPVTTYQTIVHRIGPEVTKAYLGAGGSAAERGANEQDFDPKMAPEQLRNNVRISAQLADSKIKALQDQYQRGTYGRGQQKLISEEAEGVRQRLAGGGSGGQMTPADAQAYLKKAGWLGGAPTPEQKTKAAVLAKQDGRSF